MVEALCIDDLDANGTELDDPLAELDQDLYHRLLEEPGSNLDDPDRGYGLLGRLSGSGRQGAIAPTTKHGIEGEFRKDDRVHDVRADVTEVAKGEYRIKIDVVAAEGVLNITLEGNSAGVRRVV